MPHFLVAQVKVKDQSWIPDYVANVHDIVARHGGKYLTRTANITAMEGTLPDMDMIAILEFPTLESLQAFANDPAYAPYAKARQAGTESTMFVLDAIDSAGTIPYLT